VPLPEEEEDCGYDADDVDDDDDEDGKEVDADPDDDALLDALGEDEEGDAPEEEDGFWR